MKYKIMKISQTVSNREHHTITVSKDIEKTGESWVKHWRIMGQTLENHG